MSETPAAAAPPALPPPTRAFGDLAFGWILWGGLAVVLALSFFPAEIYKVPLLFSNSQNMREYGGQLLRPDFAHWRDYAAAMWLTVQIALWGTFLAILIAVPTGLLGARNIAPFWVVQPVRRFLDVLRAMPDLVVALMFIVAVGPGPFAGVIAIAINTGGVLGKLFSEAVETVAPGPIEGVRATGASRFHEILWGVIPQAAPLWASTALYRLESNARSATVLGLIGAGGIGQMLMDSVNGFQYRDLSMIAIVIVVAVSAIDLLSQIIRKRFI